MLPVKYGEYYAFYIELRNKFVEDFFEGISPYGRDSDSGDIWDEKRDGVNIILNIIKGSSITSPRYFWRLHYRLDPKKGRDNVGMVNAIAMRKALNYLGYYNDQGVEADATISDDDKTDYIFRAFLADKTFSRKVDSKTLKSPKLGQDHSVRQCVQDFYSFLAKGDHIHAWEMLSPTFQNREIWEGNFEKFADGYATTRSIKDISTFNITFENETLSYCRIFYVDEVATYPVKGMMSLRTMTVGELEEFTVIILRLKREIEEKGGVGFDNIPISKLLEPTGMEYIWYECGFKGGALHKIFPKPVIEVVYRVYDCVCLMIDGEWKINNISPVKTYSIR